MVALTPTRQRNAVSEGLALGLLVLGRESVPNDKVRFDLALTGAWRAWPFAPRFPKALSSTGPDPIYAVSGVGATNATSALYWEKSGSDLLIRRRTAFEDDGASAEDFAYMCDLVDGGVPLEGWQELAAAFVERFER